MSRDPIARWALLILLTAGLPAATAAQSPEPALCHPGVRRLLQGDIAGAMRDLAPTAASPGDSGGARAIAQLMQGDDRAALSELERAIEQNPESSLLRYNRGIALMALRELERAATDFERVAADEGSALNARAAYHRALIALRLDGPASAEPHLRRALHLDPLLPDARLVLGWTLEEQKKWAEAGDVYKEFVSDYPNTAWAMVRFGVVALRAGYPETARTWLRRAAQADPNSVEAVEARKYLVMLE